MTDPAQAAEFAERTGVDALAVAVGNVHGFTPVPVRLDLERLRAIAAAARTARAARRLRPAGGGPPAARSRPAWSRSTSTPSCAARTCEAIRSGRRAATTSARCRSRAIEAMTRVAEEKIALLAP